MSGSRKTKKNVSRQDLKFEEAMERLETIVRELEGTEVPLERSLEMFEEGARLSKICHRKLSEAEKKVQILTKNEDGSLEPRPMDDGEPPAEDDDEESDTLF